MKESAPTTPVTDVDQGVVFTDDVAHRKDDPDDNHIGIGGR